MQPPTLRTMAVTEIRDLTIHFLLYSAALTPALDHHYTSTIGS